MRFSDPFSRGNYVLALLGVVVYSLELLQLEHVGVDLSVGFAGALGPRPGCTLILMLPLLGLG